MPGSRFGEAVERLLSEATQAVADGNWDVAHSLATEALIFEPESADAHKVLAAATRHVGRGLPVSDRRQLAVMFVDLVGSTQMSSRLDIEDYTHVSIAFEKACEPVIESYGGRLVEFFGDGLVAYFGYPRSHEDNSRRAVGAALEIQEQLARTGIVDSSIGESIRARVAVHVGEVVLSDRGSAAWTQRSAAFGPTMNVAARLQEEAEPGAVVVSGDTRDLIIEDFEFTLVGARTLKGVAEPVVVFRVDRRAEPVALSSTAARRVGPFVNRRAELGRVRDLWLQVLAAHPAVPTPSAVHITGEAGIGKSRLVEELLRLSAGEGGNPLELQCTNYGQRSTLYAVRLALDRYAEIKPADSPAEKLRKLEELVESIEMDPADAVPLLVPLMGLDPTQQYPAVELAPLQLHEAILSTLVEMAHALGRTAPFIMIVEDVQWADHATSDLIGRIIKSQPPALVVTTARGGHAMTLEEHELATLHLEQLATADTQSLAHQLLAADVPDSVADEVTSRSDGVPLYVEQLVRIMSDEPHQRHERVPRGLEELLQARLDVVGPAKQTAQLAAVIGRDFGLDTLVRAGELLGAERGPRDWATESDLRVLLDAGLVEHADEDAETLRFRHALLAEKAYDSLLAADRRAFHGAVGTALLAQAGETVDEDPAVVALHFERADRPLEAVVQLLQAAGAAVDQGALGAAWDHLDRGMGLVPLIDKRARPQLELQLRLNRGFVTSSSQGYAAPGVMEDYRAALKLCDELAERPGIGTEVVKALFGIWTFYAAAGDLDGCSEAEAMLDRALETANYPGGRPALDAARGVHRFYLGDYDAACEILERAISSQPDDEIDPTLWHLPNDPMVAGGAFLMLGRLIRGDETGASDLGRRMQERASRLPFPQGPFSMAFLTNFEVWLERCRGDADAALALSERLAQLGAEHGFADWQLVAAMNLPRCRAMKRPTLEDCRSIGIAIDMFRALGAVVLVNEVMSALADLYLQLGEIEVADALIRDAFELAEQGQRLALPEIHLAHARLLSSTGASDDEIAAAIEAAFDSAIAQGAPYFVLRCATRAAELAPSTDLSRFDQAVLDAISAFDSESAIPEVARVRELYC